MYTFKALEGNGGGLGIIIEEDGVPVYAADGLEYSAGSLAQILIDLHNTPDEIDSWDGNILHNEEILAEIRRESGKAVTRKNGEIIPMTSEELDAHFGLDDQFGPAIVADDEGIYWSRMGAAAHKDFGCLTLAQVAEIFENIIIN